MTITTRIARKEMREMLRDGRVRWTAVMVTGLLIVALTAAWNAYRAERSLREDARRATRRDWLAQTPKNPHSAAHYGIYAFKPTSPLSVIDPGVDAYSGVAAFLEAHRQNDFSYRPAQDASSVSRLGQWTAASVLQVLMPLLILLLAFSAFTAEREQGTLHQLMATGVDPGRLFAGKAAGIIGVLVIVATPGVLTGALTLSLAGGGASIASRAAWLALVYATYALVFACVSLAVSAMASSSRASLMILLAFWAANVLIAPRALADLSRLVVPTPSAFAFNRTLEDDLAAEVAATAEQSRRSGRPAGEALLASARSRGAALQEGERHGDAAFDRYYGRLHEAFTAQARFQTAASFLAPLTATRALSMALAGTDYEDHWDFASAAERYRRLLVSRMNMALLFGDTTRDGRPVDGNAALWRSVPPFTYQPATTTSTLEREALAFLVLLAWIAGAPIAAHLAVRRLSTPTLAR